MANVFIIHGAYGYPEENWFPWLKDELEKLGCNVVVPKFPTPENQTLDNWIDVLERYRNRINQKTIMIGHSLGVPFILRILEQWDTKVQATFLIAGLVRLINDPKFDRINETFLDSAFNYDIILRKCRKFHVIHSEDDPIVPFKQGEVIAQNLKTELITMKNAGHFNTAAGFERFDFLLERIKKEL